MSDKRAADLEIQTHEDAKIKAKLWARETMLEYKDMFGTTIFGYILFNWDDDRVQKMMQYAYLEGFVDGQKFADEETIEMLKQAFPDTVQQRDTSNNEQQSEQAEVQA